MAPSEKDVQRLLTIAEFERVPESDQYLFELSRGVLIREPRPGLPHGTVVVLVGKHLVDYALEHGGVVTTETGYVLEEGPDTLRGPHVAYTRGGPTPYRQHDTLDGGDVLPGFALRVAELIRC